MFFELDYREGQFYEKMPNSKKIIFWWVPTHSGSNILALLIFQYVKIPNVIVPNVIVPNVIIPKLRNNPDNSPFPPHLA